MNRGERAGLNPEGWRYYTPIFDASRTPGHAEVVHPDLGNSTVLGRYLRFTSGMVICQVYFGFGSTFTPGTCELYIVGLPFPANRWATAVTTSSADTPIGEGMATQGTTTNASASTTVAAGSNTVNTNTFTGNGTLNVASTSTFASNGKFTVATGGTTATITYSGITATTFVGCNTLSGGGAMSTGGAVTGVDATNMAVVVIPTLTDNLAPVALQTNEDYYAHIFIAHSKNVGTGTIAQGTTSTTCYHGLGLTPVASDFYITPTGNPTTNPGLLSVQNITATTFDVFANVSIASGTVPFGWKAMVEPNNSAVSFPQLVNYQRPWIWGPGHTLSLQMIYEARF